MEPVPPPQPDRFPHKGWKAVHRRGEKVRAIHEPQRVSAAEFIRGFANWRLQSARKPVVVTHHGKDAHVLISLDDYQRLDREGKRADSLHRSLAGTVEAFRDAVILIDRQWRIVTANPAAGDMLETAAAALTGKPLTDVIGGLNGSLLLHHLVRLIDYRERFSGDMPGLLTPRQWLRVDLVPVPVGGAIILRDVSAAMEEIAVGDARQALESAVEAHGALGQVRLSPRAQVEDANAALLEMVGADAVAITRVRFSALLPTGRRQAFAEALETVFRGGRPVRIVSELVSREGVALPVTLVIAERRGPYASEGAIILVTPD